MQRIRRKCANYGRIVARIGLLYALAAIISGCNPASESSLPEPQGVAVGYECGETGKKYPSNVTLIEEGGGRFFSTADLEVCWTDIDELETVDDMGTLFAISGAVYCVAPLTEVNGNSDVSIRDFRFRGLLDWDAS